MKPNAILAIALLTWALVHFGNACSPSFQKLNESGVSVQSCAQDESSLTSSLRDWKIGYLGSRKVLYYERGDGWIVVEGDQMYRTNGSLPTQPARAGTFQGVGVAGSDRWPGGKIPYVINSALPNSTRVTDAITHWNTNLQGKITLVARTNEYDYVEFVRAIEGCFAPVGYFPGAGQHPVSLSDQCGSGNAAHEIGHVVGLNHEQNRLDRDSFVAINFTKVMDGYANNFSIDTSFRNYMTYDFGSIMHYSLNAFSTDGSRTIIPKVTVLSNIIVGQRQGLSSGDIASVNEMYANSGLMPSTTDTTATATPSEKSGLNGHYYTTKSFQGLAYQQIDSQLDKSWGLSAPQGLPADDFSVRWRGWLVPSESGYYQLSAIGQDGYRIILVDQNLTLVDKLTSTGLSTYESGQLKFSAGVRYKILIEFVAQKGEASFRLAWRKDGGPSEVIPAANMEADTTKELPSNICTGA